MNKRFWLCVFFAFSILMPIAASAHEVYVLSPAEIKADIASPSPITFAIVTTHAGQFTFWAFITILTIVTIFFISISHWLENKLDPFFAKTKRWAPLVGRVTMGISFLAAAYYQATYGPELPIAPAYGIYTPFITVVLIILGLLIIFGIYTRIAAVASLCIFGYSVYLHGVYMLTYLNYFGETMMLLLGVHSFSAIEGDVGKTKDVLLRVGKKITPYAFLILRVCFGIALIYASAYAKLIHGWLALQTVTLPLAGHPYGLAHYFGLEPHFFVLGAAIIEILIGLFFIFGIEIRFTAVFLMFWLTLSLIYFGEIVWPHLILFGIPIAFICYGYDKYSLEGFLFKRNGREPIL
ncbi:MAG TPA: DoxX family membrane protein [Candidatus Paceibacterota bacterium]|nr:DoxX family membrane protein [Candidatus Paceibacterota bacterium]